jgi:16S rRNA (uracil1498-N3)-methyltransferase
LQGLAPFHRVDHFEPYNSVQVHRFFAPALDAGDEMVTLPRDEAEHLRRVLRLGVGDTVAVFDGRGHEYLARVASVLRRDVRLQIQSRVEPPPESNVALTLAQAVLKSDKMDDVVRDAVMLGVAAVQPIVMKRTETTVAALIRSARVERWRRVALASVKQSRRAVLPDVRMPLTFENFLDEPAASLRLMLVEPSACGGSPVSQLQRQPIPADASVLVGPEGGWTAEECAAATARGVRLITLGHRTLRADAVPIAAISVLQFLWNDL